MKNFSNRKGFTLVELLIVIVVIGVLSAMMMLSSTEAVSSAKATKIINDLTNIKKATLAWYTDNLDKITDNGKKVNNGWIQNVNKNDVLGIGKYLNSGSGIVLNKNGGEVKEGDYAILSVGNDGVDGGTSDSNKDSNRSTWYVGYNFDKDGSRVKEKLKGRATSLGLHFTSKYPQTPSDGNIVWMKIFGDWSPSN